MNAEWRARKPAAPAHSSTIFHAVCSITQPRRTWRVGVFNGRFVQRGCLSSQFASTGRAGGGSSSRKGGAEVATPPHMGPRTEGLVMQVMQVIQEDGNGENRKVKGG